MARPLSEDLRKRLMASVDAPCRHRQVRRHCLDRDETHEASAEHGLAGAGKKQGGDRRSDRIEAHADEIVALVAVSPDITLEEIAAHLKEAHGETFVVSPIWRCLDRHGSSLKKSGARKRAEARRRGGGPGAVARRAA